MEITAVLFHASISAHEPERVASVLARFWGGEAMPFPPMEGAFVALAGDDRGTMIEVSPFGTEMVPGEAMVGFASNPKAESYVANHQAIGTSLSEAEVLAIARQEGWTAMRCDRGPFEVIEVWLENRILVEVLTPQMQRQYVSAITIPNWRRLVRESANRPFHPDAVATTPLPAVAAVA